MKSDQGRKNSNFKNLKTVLLLVLAAASIYGIINSDSEIYRAAKQLIETTFLESQEDNRLGEKVDLVRVVDGDTVIIRDSSGVEERVRLLLIDTPESVHPTEAEQLFGKESSQFAVNFIESGKELILERGYPERDKYDRLLAYLFVDGKNFNQLMIEEGYARVAYVFEPNTKYIDDFRAAEQEARASKLKIWSIPGYVTDRGFDMSVVK